jgi:cytochrome d ubiquinol oxidase subunit I
MFGACVTGAFFMAAVGAYYVLARKHTTYGTLFLGVGVPAALLASLIQLFPTGDRSGQLVTQYQPITLAAMEGLFHSESGADIVLIGQPNMDEQKLDNPIHVPKALSFVTYRHWEARVMGLNEFPRDRWPDNIPLLYYSYHIMVGLGTIFIVIALVAALLLFRGRLFDARSMLWILMLSFPFPFIANTAGWITAELGRQPWLVYGLMRTESGFSHRVSSANGLFSLLGFMGMYTVLSILFMFLIWHDVNRGVED